MEVVVVKKRLRLKAGAFYLFASIFVAIIFFTSFKLIVWQTDNQKIAKLIKELNSITTVIIVEEEGTPVNPPDEKEEKEEVISDYWYYVSFPFYQVDFTKLKKKNSDTVAYIHIDSTNINYPIVQTDNNDYYLTHAFDKTNNSAGWVYMDYRNSFDPLSDNLIIYGHGRIDNTVFGSLKKTLTKEWQSKKENFIVNISTPNNNYLYQIFSIYTIEEESYYLRSKFGTSEEKQEWINTMVQRNIVSEVATSVNESDKILTLSTCYNDDGIRLVVQAKLIKTSN